MPAFQEAVRLGADYIEVDVRTTSGGELVLSHDNTVDRCTSGHGEVSKMTFEEIRALDAGAKAGAEFTEEAKPVAYSEEDCFDWVRRSILKAAGVAQVEDLTAEHLSSLRENHRRLTELLESFKQISLVLIRAAKMAAAPLPEGKGYQEIRKAQQDVLKELTDCEKIILNPDVVNVRLNPRLSKLEQLYVEAYLGELMRLNSIHGQIADLGASVGTSPEFQVLEDFAGEVPEAKRILDAAKESAGDFPVALRRSPEDRDKAEKEVKSEAKVKDLQSQDLTFKRLKQECEDRLVAQSGLSGVPSAALTDFAEFLLAPGVVEQLKTIENRLATTPSVRHGSWLPSKPRPHHSRPEIWGRRSLFDLGAVLTCKGTRAGNNCH